MQDDPGLTENERAELNRLRAENAALRAQGQAAPQPPRPGGRQRWRTIVAVLLIVLGCVLAPLAGVAVWARNQVTNSDRYVATITPLASDPAIQQAITDQITTQVFTAIDIQALTTQVVDALSARVEGRGLPPQAAAALQGLAGPVANGVEGFVRTQVERTLTVRAGKGVVDRQGDPARMGELGDGGKIDQLEQRLGRALRVELTLRAVLIAGGRTARGPAGTLAGHVVDYSRIVHPRAP